MQYAGTLVCWGWSVALGFVSWGLLRWCWGGFGLVDRGILDVKNYCVGDCGVCVCCWDWLG